jgi:hypothetical protein
LFFVIGSLINDASIRSDLDFIIGVHTPTVKAAQPGLCVETFNVLPIRQDTISSLIIRASSFPPIREIRVIRGLLFSFQ